MDLEDENNEDTEEKLEITEVPHIVFSISQIVNDTETDIEYSRDKMKSLIDQSCEAINHMMALASDSEHPRAFEVLSTMIKHTSEMSQDLVKLQKTRKDITQEKSGPSSTTTNNSIFVGSTTELQKYLKKNNDDEESIDV
jgi:TRAP-type mannitol/chloroaromatic compound transport system substrate-binding protein